MIDDFILSDFWLQMRKEVLQRTGSQPTIYYCRLEYGTRPFGKS